MPAKEIANRLAEVRKEEKAIAHERASTKTPLTKEEAQQRIAARKAEKIAADERAEARRVAHYKKEEAAQERKEGRAERITPVIVEFAKSLTDENMVDLVDILNDYVTE